nr:MAG TPA: hypothetical protein [Caudoviricetes sp.]
MRLFFLKIVFVLSTKKNECQRIADTLLSVDRCNFAS